MIGLIFATEIEAQPTIALFNAQKATKAMRLPVYHFDTASGESGTLVISGMGKVAATLATGLLAELGARSIFNAGICGAVGKATIATVYHAKTVRDGDLPQATSYNSSMQLAQKLPTATLVTRDRPVYDQSLRAETAAGGGLLVDMEGVAVASAADYHQLPWVLIKGVSDLASDRETLLKNLSAVSKEIASTLKILL